MMKKAAFQEPVAERSGGRPRWSTEESSTHFSCSSAAAWTPLKPCLKLITFLSSFVSLK